jgi:hypothetical protein
MKMRNSIRTALSLRSIGAWLFLVPLLTTAAGSWAQETGPGQDSIFKPVRYGLAVKVDFERSVIDANCRLTVENPGDLPVSRFSFVLYRLLKVSSIKDLAGNSLTFTQDVKPYEDEEKFRADLVEVSLPEPLASRQTATLDIAYSGTLRGYVDAGKTYVKDTIDKDFTIIRMDCLAYPQPGVASWRQNISTGLPSFDYELTVTVPEGWTVANGGALVSTAKKDGLVTYTYKNIKPAWRMDAAIAPYEISADDARHIRVYYFPADAEGAKTVFGGLVNCLDLFSDRFGRLADFRGFAVIEVPLGFGSQADVTSILLTKDVFTDKSRLTDLYHEVSHLWNAPARDPLPCRVESEGVAMYLQYWAQEKLEKKAGALEAGAARLRASFLKACDKNPKAAGTPIIDYGKADLTDLSYNKGMLFFYMLDKVAGRENLLSALRDCQRQYMTSGATTQQYMDCLKAKLGPAIDPVVQDWLFGTRSSDLLESTQTLDQIAAGYKRR